MSIHRQLARRDVENAKLRTPRGAVDAARARNHHASVSLWFANGFARERSSVS
jgi:hypothetical protein